MHGEVRPVCPSPINFSPTLFAHYSLSKPKERTLGNTGDKQTLLQAQVQAIPAALTTTVLACMFF